jgi:ATP-binding cassette subfamily B protein
MAVATSLGRDLLTLIGLIVVMVWRSPLLALVILIAGPIVIFGVTGLVRRIRRIAESEFRSLGAVIRTTQETARGVRIVKAFNLEDQMRAHMAQSVGEVQQRADKGAAVAARANPIMETVIGIAVAGVMSYAGYAVIYEGASPGSFLAFLAAMLLAYEPAMRLARLNVQLSQHLVGVRILYELLDAPPAHPDDAGRPALQIGPGEIVFDRVTFAYRPDTPLFRDLDFTAEAGRTTALVGPSGAGKSTVIGLIERFFEPQGGRVLIDGQDIAGVSVASLRQEIALVSQEVHLFSGTVRENIRYGRADATDAEVEDAARSALAHDFIMALPDGYETPVGEHGAQLSGGQRQRVAIARAMVRNARIVLLDEATSALDSESEHQVQVAFERLRQGRTTVVIAHRLSTVLNADRICVFLAGEIVEQGTHRELLAAGQSYARLYRLQFDPEARRQPEPDAEEPPAEAAQ